MMVHLPCVLVNLTIHVGQSLRTLQGEDLKISRRGDNLYVNQALVTSADHPAQNGVIHLIDAVLIPRSIGNYCCRITYRL